MGSFFQTAIFQYTSTQFREIVPYLVLAFGFGLAVILAGFKASPKIVRMTGFAIFGIALLLWIYLLSTNDDVVLGLSITKYSKLVGAIVCGFGACTLGVFRIHERYARRPEWLALLILCVMGLALLPASRDWVSFFVFLELFSIPAYILAGYDVGREKSLEASLKYLLTGSFASALLLMGIALIYLASGAVDYISLASTLPNNNLAEVGILLIIAGAFFKMTIAPFHFWAPDVYQGAPTAIAAFLAAGTKISVFVAVSIAFREAEFIMRPQVHAFAIAAGALSIILGSFLAYTQRSFRRMLAYSGTVNAGTLAPLMVSGTIGISSGMFFLFVYGTTLFLVLSPFASLVARRGLDPNDDLDVESFSRTDATLSPVQTMVMAAGLFSLAGIPPFPGFFVKYWVFSDLWKHGDRGLVILGLLGTLFGVAYYIRIAGKFFFAEKKPFALSNLH